MRQCVLLFTLVANIYADTKVWNKNVNFYNGENWGTGRSPCPSDTLYIPDESTSIFLQTNGTLKELVLPMDGEIVLANDLKLAFSDDPLVDTDCPGQDLSFIRKGSESWLTPDNWNKSDFIPIESDQVPCEYDDIQFPSNSQFYVGLDESVLVRSLTIGGQFLTSTLDATNYLQSSQGRRQFDLSGNAALRLSGIGCGESNGCVCGNNKKEVLKKICSSVICQTIACQDPVTPEGSCCNMCGGFITLYLDNKNFNFEQIKATLADTYSLGTSGTDRVRRDVATDGVAVSMYMSKPADDRVQLVLTDNGQGTGNGKEASQVTQQIYTDITRDPNSFGVVSVNASFSGGPGAQGSSGLGGGLAAGIIITLIIAVIVVVSVIFIMFRRQPLWFRKDEPLDADIEMPSMKKKHMPDIPSPELHAVEFDNPVYGKAVQNLYQDPTVEANGNVEEVGTVDDGFYNPMAI